MLSGALAGMPVAPRGQCSCWDLQRLTTEHTSGQVPCLREEKSPSRRRWQLHSRQLQGSAAAPAGTRAWRDAGLIASTYIVGKMEMLKDFARSCPAIEDWVLLRAEHSFSESAKSFSVCVALMK